MEVNNFAPKIAFIFDNDHYDPEQNSENSIFVVRAGKGQKNLNESII